MFHLVPLAAALAALHTGDPVPKPKDQGVTIAFRAMVGDKPFACGVHYQNMGRTKAETFASEFKFYVHGVRLIKKDGTEVPVTLAQDSLWQNGDVGMLDFEDGTGPCSNGTPTTNMSIRGTVPAGKYTGVRFIVGVPVERNHLDLAAQHAPLSISRMFWSWTSGYKFMRIDLRSVRPDTTATVPWVIHLGSTECTANATKGEPSTCANANRPEIVFKQFDVTRDAVVLDLAALVANADLMSNQPKTAAGCMSGTDDADCAPVFSALGLAHPKEEAPAVQKAFRVWQKAIP